MTGDPTGTAGAPPTRAVGYVRVSTEEQKKNGWNLDADRARIERTAAARGWDLVRIYDDGGRQGDDPTRPGFIQMLADVDEFDVLIVRDLDRFSRRLAIYASAVDELVEADVHLYEFEGDDGTGLRRLNLDDEDDRALADVKAVFAQMEKAKTRRRTRQAKRARGRAGYFNGGSRPPYGYRLTEPREVPGRERPTRLLEVDEEQAKVVRRIYADALARVSQMGTATALNREGIPTAAGSPQWNQAQVRKVLTSPVYVGMIRINGEVHPGQHDGIVEPEVWAAAQRLREDAARERGNRGGRYPAGAHLFTKGLLRCGSCGGPMIPRTIPNRTGGTAQTYFCLSHRQLAESCPQGPVRRADVDDAMITELHRRFLDVEATRERLAGRLAADRDLAEETVAQAERDLARAEDALERTERDYDAGILDGRQYAKREARLSGERDAAEAALERARDHAARLSESRPPDAEAELLRRMAAVRAAISEGIGEAPNLNAARRLLRELFESVVYVPGDATAADLPIPEPESADWDAADPVPTPGAHLFPVLRPGVVDGYLAGPADGDPAPTPAYARRALDLAETDNGVLSPESVLFPPIPVAGQR